MNSGTSCEAGLLPRNSSLDIPIPLPALDLKVFFPPNNLFSILPEPLLLCSTLVNTKSRQPRHFHLCYILSPGLPTFLSYQPAIDSTTTTTIPMAHPPPIDSSTAQTLVAIVFGVTASIISGVTIYQGRRSWQMWREYGRAQRRSQRNPRYCSQRRRGSFFFWCTRLTSVLADLELGELGPSPSMPPMADASTSASDVAPASRSAVPEEHARPPSADIGSEDQGFETGVGRHG